MSATHGVRRNGVPRYWHEARRAGHGTCVHVRTHDTVVGEGGGGGAGKELGGQGQKNTKGGGGGGVRVRCRRLALNLYIIRQGNGPKTRPLRNATHATTRTVPPFQAVPVSTGPWNLWARKSSDMPKGIIEGLLACINPSSRRYSLDKRLSHNEDRSFARSSSRQGPVPNNARGTVRCRVRYRAGGRARARGGFTW